MRYSWIVVTVGLAVAAHASDAQARLDLYVDKSTQRIAVVQDGYMRYIWPVSTGRDGYATPNGVYSPERLERSWFSRAYYDAPMPYAIFFHNGYAIHGSDDLERLGGPASHGCIRLYPQHAAILFAMVEQEGPENTTIMVGGDGQPIPRAPHYRDMGDLVRSAAPVEGGIAKPIYPPLPPPTPNREMDRNMETPGWQGGDPAQLARGPYRLPGPRSDPYRDLDHNVEAPGRQGGDSGQLTGKGVYRSPAPRNELKRDMDHSAEVPVRRSGDNGQLAGKSGAARLPVPRNEPNRDLDRNAEAAVRRSDDTGPLAGKGGGSRLPAPRSDTGDANEAPKASRGEPDEAASNRANPSVTGKSAPEQPQSNSGYKVLPRSYWTGASWRWRSNGEQDAR